MTNDPKAKHADHFTAVGRQAVLGLRPYESQSSQHTLFDNRKASNQTDKSSSYLQDVDKMSQLMRHSLKQQDLNDKLQVAQQNLLSSTEKHVSKLALEQRLDN